MTRRIVKPRSKRRPSLFNGEWADDYVLDPGNAEWRARDVPYEVGDMLWVRETWCTHRDHDAIAPSQLFDHRRAVIVSYDADGEDRYEWLGRRRASMHMPRTASRLTLNVTGVKVERLNDISEEDAIAEGVPYDYGEHIHGPGGYRDIWEKINGPGSWEANPWIVAISFELATPTGTNR